MTVHQFMRARPGTSFLVFVVLMVLLVAFAPRCARAQTWRGYQVTVGAPDCRLAARSSEDFITDGSNQIYARRWQLEGIRIGGAFLASWAVHHFVLPKRPVLSAFVGGVGVGFIPHIRSQLIQRRYPIDLSHDAAQVAQSMVPFIVVESHKDHGIGGHVNAALTTAAVILGSACWAQY